MATLNIILINNNIINSCVILWFEGLEGFKCFEGFDCFKGLVGFEGFECFEN